jgi:hypothetical protein
MKRNISLAALIALLMNMHNAFAIKDSTSKQNFYGAWSFSSGILFCPANSGQLYVSFPYITNTNGSTNGTTHTFSGTVNNPYTKQDIIVNILSIELGGFRHFYTCRLGAYTNSESAVKLEVGTGYNFYFDPLHNTTLPARKKLLVIKPFVNGCFAQHGTSSDDDNTFGTLNNTGTNIAAFGHVAGATYTVNGRTGSHTDSAQVLDIYYRQNDWMLIPGISISNNHYVHQLHIEIICCYYLPLFEQAGLKFDQDQYHSTGDLVPFGTPNLTATFNGKNTMVPYQFSGFYLGIILGINFSGSPVHFSTSKK